MESIKIIDLPTGNLMTTYMIGFDYLTNMGHTHSNNGSRTFPPRLMKRMLLKLKLD